LRFDLRREEKEPAQRKRGPLRSFKRRWALFEADLQARGCAKKENVRIMPFQGVCSSGLLDHSV